MESETLRSAIVPIVVVTLIVALVLATVLPQKYITDASGISSEDILCAKEETQAILENPIERILIIKTSVDKKVGDTLFTTAYTLGGITWAKVELICGKASHRVS